MIIAQIKASMEQAKLAGDDSFSDVDVDLGYGTARSSDASLLDDDVNEVRGKPMDDGALGPPTSWDPVKYEAALAEKRRANGDDGAWAHRKVKVGNKKRPWDPKFFDLDKFWGPGWGPAFTRPGVLALEGFRHNEHGPVPLDGVEHVTVGKGHAMCVTRQGKLFTWGEDNENAQLGVAQTQGAVRVRYEPVRRPEQNPTLAVHAVTKRVVVGVSAGSMHSAAVAADGTLYAWGSSVRGRLGLGTESTQRLGVGEGIGRVYPAPTVLGMRSLLGKVVTQVACGTMHTVCVANHKVFVWGDGYGGRLGNGSNLSVVVTHPQLVEDLKDKYAVQVACGMWHSFALCRESSSLSDDEHSLAAATDPALAATAEPSFASVTYPSLSEASLPEWRSHVMYFPPTVEGKLYVWGTGTDGQLGIGEPAEASRPVPVPYLPKGYAPSTLASWVVYGRWLVVDCVGVVFVAFLQRLVRHVFPVPLCRPHLQGVAVHVGPWHRRQLGPATPQRTVV